MQMLERPHSKLNIICKWHASAGDNQICTELSYSNNPSNSVLFLLFVIVKIS